MSKKVKASAGPMNELVAQQRLVDLAEVIDTVIGATAAAHKMRLLAAGAVRSVTPLKQGLLGILTDPDGGQIVATCTADRSGGTRIGCSCGDSKCGHVGAALAAWSELFAATVLAGELPPIGRTQNLSASRAALAPTAAPAPAVAPSATAAVAAPEPGTPIEDTRRFAAAHGAAADIDRAVRNVASELHLVGTAHWFAAYDTRSVGEIIAVSSARSADIRAVQKALCAWLARRCLGHAKAAAEEVERLARRARPLDPVAARVFDALEGERNRLRQTLPPLPKGVVGAHLTIEAEPPTLTYTGYDEAGCRGYRGRPSGTVHLHGPDASTVAEVVCSCPPPRSVACEVRLATVDAALDLLCGASRANERDALLHATTVPDWERTLRALDRSLLEEDAAAEGQLAFVIENAYTLRVKLALASPAKRGGFKLKKVARRGLGPVQMTAIEQHVVDLLYPIARHDVIDATAEGAVRALDRLVGHPRVFLAGGPKTPIRVERQDVALVADRGESGSIRLRVRIGDDAVTPAEARTWLVGCSGGLLPWFAPTLDRCVVLRVRPAVERVIRELAARPDELPPEATAGLLDRLPRLAERCGVSVDPSLRGREEPAATTPHVRLALTADGHLEVHVRTRPLPDAQAVVPGEGFPEVFVHRDDGTVCGVRALAAERDSARSLEEDLGLHEDSAVSPHSWELPPSDFALEVIESSQSLGTTEVLWADERRPLIVGGGASQLKVKVGSTTNWLALGGELRTSSGGVPLAELLAAVRDERRFVKVGDRHWVRIEDALRQQLEATAHLAREQGGESVLPTLAAPLVDALRESGAEVEADSSWLALVEQMRAADRAEPVIPDTLLAELRPYQAAGVRWMLRLAGWARGACLADDMGLGKTVQALAVMLHRAAAGPTLVVAPTSVGFNWAREAERFAPSLRVVAFRGRDSLDMLEDVAEGDVVVTSYDLLARYDDQLGSISWHTLVLDEAQAIKNPSTLRARSVFGLEAAFVLALTGTPIENHTGELWSLFRAVAPGLLGSLDDFQKRFAVPIERYREAKARRALAYLVRPFVLRRLKAEVAPELPARTDVRMDVELSAGERRLYDDLRAAAIDALSTSDPTVPPEKRRFQILAALTRLRQLACHPRLVDPHAHVSSSKLRVLREIVAELRDGGHRALVFSQFTSLLALVREALLEDGARLRYLDGSTPAQKRREEVDAFQRGEADVFLLSLKAGGTGLNLTAADYVIHLDPWWNPAVEDQATDRAHRIGQDNPVTVIRLVSTGTVEEGILAMHADKRELVGAVLDGTGAAASLSLDDMMALLTAGATGMVDEEEDAPLR